jgi:hypothetical protein
MPPAAAREEIPSQPELAVPSAEELARGDDFLSPFADELDVPTFLRRRRKDSEGEENRELPAFLRRSAD